MGIMNLKKPWVGIEKEYMKDFTRTCDLDHPTSSMNNIDDIQDIRVPRRYIK